MGLFFSHAQWWWVFTVYWTTAEMRERGAVGIEITNIISFSIKAEHCFNSFDFF